MNEESKANYLVYSAVFVLLLIIIGIVGSFAFYKGSSSFESNLNSISSTLECVDLNLSESTTNVGLTTDYPITDNLATSGGATPITVKITNNCNNTAYYSLALSTMFKNNESSNYIEDSKIRYKVDKDSSVLKSTNYLSNLTTFATTSKTYKDLTGVNGELTVKYPNYTLKNIYAIVDNISIAKNTSNTYQIYMWVDYYEGDATMYSNPTATHDTSYDGTTENKKFAAAISLSIQPAM